MNEPYLYYLFREGVFIGKFTELQGAKLTAEDIFRCHIYR